MANICKLMPGGGGTLSRRYRDERTTDTFWVKLDTPTRDIVAIADAARAANPAEFPLRGQSWPARPGYGLFADMFNVDMISQLNKVWKITVTYTPLDPEEPNTEATNSNPLLWAKVFGLEWIDTEVPIEKGKNREAIGAASIVGERAIGTLGALVNSALQEFDEPLMRTKRIPVITVTDNVATLAEIWSTQTQFEDTTNSDTISGVGPKRFEYLCVDHEGQQTANGIPYFKRIRKVALKKTTDRIVNNVGWGSWVTKEGVKKLKRITVLDEEADEQVPSSEPGFLTLAGAHGFNPTTLSYGVLDEVPYASILL
jgi:hypothetical protein